MDATRREPAAPSAVRRGNATLLHVSLVLTDLVAIVFCFLGFREFSLLREATADELRAQQGWFGAGALVAAAGVVVAFVAVARAGNVGERITFIVVALFGIGGVLFQGVLWLLATLALLG